MGDLSQILFIPGLMSNDAGGTEAVADVQRFFYPGQTPYTRYASGTSYARDVSTTGTYRTPQVGRCLTLNGSSEYLTLGSRLTSGSLTALTVSCWVKTTDIDGTMLSEYHFTDNNRGWYLSINNGVQPNKLNVIISADGGAVNAKSYTSSTTINDGNWHHVAFTFDAGVLKLFIGGVEESTTKHIDGTVASIFDSTSELRIGTQTGPFYFAGSISNVRIYTRALTPAEIAILADWNQQDNAALLTDASLAGHWDLENNEYDRSGNGNHLTLVGTAGTMRATDTGVRWSFANETGYSDGAGGIIVPRDDSDTTNDVLGNPLDYTGRSPYDGPLGGLPCVTLDGSSEYLSSAPTDFAEHTNYSVASWFTFPSHDANYRHIYTEWDTPSSKFRIVVGSDPTYRGQISFWVRSGGTTRHVVTNSRYDDGNWHHVVCVFSSGVQTVYVDGQSVALTVVLSGTVSSLQSMSALIRGVGGQPLATGGVPSSFWSGSLSNVRIYTTALSAGDIALLAARGEPSTAPLACWPLTERSGTTVYDTSGNGHNLTLTSAAPATVWGSATNTHNDHLIKYGGRKSGSVYIPGRLTGGLAADGNALTFGPGQLPDDGSYVNRKAANYPALLQVEDYWGLLDDDERTGEAVAPPKIATDTGTARHTFRTPPAASTYYAEFTYRTTSADEAVIVPTVSGNTYNFTIDWGDGSATSTVTAWDDADRQHTYATAGDYVVRIVGACPRLQFYQSISEDQIIAADLGTMLWTHMGSMFRGAGALGPVVGGNTRYVTSMAYMFHGAPSANPDTSSWNVSSVTNMTSMFHGATSANPDTSSWNVSSVTNMTSMFQGATSANPDTSSWDVSSVTSMYATFQGATSANPDTSSWDVSGVTNMSYMFFGAQSANPDTSSWDVSSVTNMYGMFTNATSANPDTSTWVTTSLTNATYIASGATGWTNAANASAFWSNPGVTSYTNAFTGATNISNYASIPAAWGGGGA